jgi:hypothetical protein
VRCLLVSKLSAAEVQFFVRPGRFGFLRHRVLPLAESATAGSVTCASSAPVSLACLFLCAPGAKLLLFVSASRTTGLVLCFSFTAPKFCSRMDFSICFSCQQGAVILHMLVPSCQVAVLVLIFYAVSVLSQDPSQCIDPRFSFGSCACELASSIREFCTGVARSSALQYNLASSSSVFSECVRFL